MRIEPNKRLDTMDLVEMFKEPVSYSDKPLGVLSFRPSKEEDWFLYAVHNEQYLAMHGNPDTEKIPYSVDDIVVSDGYMLAETFARAMAHLRHSNASVVKQLRDGVSPNSLIEQGYNPFAVSTILKLQHRDDYDELMGKYERLATAYRDLVSLIKDKGYDVRYEEQGKSKVPVMTLVPRDDFFDKLFEEVF